MLSMSLDLKLASREWSHMDHSLIQKLLKFFFSSLQKHLLAEIHRLEYRYIFTTLSSLLKFRFFFFCLRMKCLILKQQHTIKFIWQLNFVIKHLIALHNLQNLQMFYSHKVNHLQKFYHMQLQLFFNLLMM